MRKEFNLQFDNSYLSLPECFYTQCNPTTVRAPEVVIFNSDLAEKVGLDFSNISPKEKAAILSGNHRLNGGGYFSQAYAGHQFGYFTMLGDGRAITWGEHVTAKGKRFDIQFKGSGRTAYSGNGDGRAALGPVLREYIISEAMHHLGIPTTRSLAVIKTGEDVIRETMLPGAILTRIASSHLRVGTFEFAAAQTEQRAIAELLGYTVARHYPELIDTDNQAAALLKAVVEKQADLIVQWMRVGFIHGVMNTDNMALSGETIDYGPCAFMDSYNPKTVFSSIDQQGRYAYHNQPYIAQWNLARLAETLLPLINANPNKAIDIAEEIIGSFSNVYHSKWLQMMRTKLGLSGSNHNDALLIDDLLNWMHSNHTDFTNTFSDLGQKNKPSGEHYDSQQFNDWYQRWQERLPKDPESLNQALDSMKAANPAVIPRNHQVEKVLTAANTGDFSALYEFLEVLKQPYKSNDKFKAYQLPPLPSERVYQTFCGT